MTQESEESFAEEPYELDDDAVFDLIDLDEETERLRGLSVKSSWFLPLWALLCALGISAMVHQVVDGANTGAAGALLLSLGIGGVILSARSAAGWRRRYLSAKADGWRFARVSVKPDHGQVVNRLSPAVHLAFEDGSETVLRPATWTLRSCRRYRETPGAKVWVAGEGEDFVVLFSEGWVAPVPYAFPARPEFATETTVREARKRPREW